MSREFFTLVADALPGFVPPSLREYESRVTAGNVKVWFEPEHHEHYEVQVISRAAARAAKLSTRATILEIGFHAEHRDEDANEDVVARVRHAKLGRNAVAGAFVGRPSPWRRVSEIWLDAALDDGAAVEAAERLARYIKAIEAIRRAR